MYHACPGVNYKSPGGFKLTEYRSFQRPGALWTLPPRAQQSVQRNADLASQEWGHRVSNLFKLLGIVANEPVIVGKSLESSCFTDRKCAALERIRVNKIMPIFRDMARNGRGGIVPKLNTEAVRKNPRFPILVTRRESDRVLFCYRGAPASFRVN